MWVKMQKFNWQFNRHATQPQFQSTAKCIKEWLLQLLPNWGPLVSEVTALPTEPQPLPLVLQFWSLDHFQSALSLKNDPSWERRIRLSIKCCCFFFLSFYCQRACACLRKKEAGVASHRLVVFLADSETRLGDYFWKALAANFLAKVAKNIWWFCGVD